MIGPNGMTVFVPNGASRKDTATVLVGTADEYGIDQRSIRATRGGFYVTDELADLIYADEDAADEGAADGGAADEGTKPAPSKTKTSGNRAAKKNTSKKE